MADPIWYLGPAGDMRPLVCPERDVDITVERYGGVFQGLSGARSMTVTGHKQRFQFELRYLDEDEYSWLEALHFRNIVPQMYRLRNPFKKNMLSPQASMIKTLGDTRTVQFVGGVTVPTSLDWPSAAGNLGNVSTKWINRPGGTSVFRLEDRYNVPVTPGLAVTFSLYMKASGPVTGSLLIDWHDALGNQIGSSSTVPVVLTTSWQRVSVTGIPMAGGVRARPAFFTAMNSPDISFAAAQFEEGNTPTAWQAGGGAPVVLVDQLETLTPRFPYRNTTLTLLEA